jgi:hypothetical protein
MLFKSQLITQASGSVGGTTFARNSYGMYTRARAKPVNPNTPAQQLIRNAMAQAHEAWNALTKTVQDTWNSYATNTTIPNRLGDPVKLTGRAHYLRQYVLRSQAGLSPITSAPTVPGLTQLSTVTVTATTEQLSVAFNNQDEWASHAGGFLAVYESPPQGPGINYYRGPYRYVGKVAGAATPPTSPQTFQHAFPVSTGDKVFIRLVAVTHGGRLSTQQFKSCVVSGS